MDIAMLYFAAFLAGLVVGVILGLALVAMTERVSADMRRALQ